FDYFCGHPPHNCIRWNVFSYNCSSRNNTSRTNSHTLQNRHTMPYPDIILNSHGLCSYTLEVHWHIQSVKAMIGVAYSNCLSDHYIISNFYSLIDTKYTEVPTECSEPKIDFPGSLDQGVISYCISTCKYNSQIALSSHRPYT